MSLKGRMLALLIVAAILAALAWLVWRPSDPLFQGRRESVWVMELNNPQRNELFAQWRGFGAAAVPVLIKALHKGSGPMERRYAELWPKLPGAVRRRLPVPVDYWQGRNNAALLLGELGTQAISAVPELARAMSDRDPNVRVNAAKCLENLMPVLGSGKKRLVKYFIAAANDPNYWVRADAMSFLAYYPDDSHAAAPLLVKALDDPERSVRAGAMQALNAMNNEAAVRAGLTPALVKELQNPELSIRIFAARKLGMMRADPKTVVPALTALLADDAAVARFTAAAALGRYGKDAQPAIPALTKLLEAPEPPVRAAASNALQQIDPAAVAGSGARGIK